MATHWAADEDPSKVAAAMLERFRNYQKTVRETDFDRMKLATFAYYGCDEDGNDSSRIKKKGKQGQLRYVVDNEFRSIIRNKLTIATATPPGFLPVPINTDADSQADSLLTRGLLDYYFDERKVDRVCDRATEMAEVLSWAWVDVSWDDAIGPVVGQAPVFGEAPPAVEGQPPPQRPVVDAKDVLGGDAVVRAMMPTDVAVDANGRGPSQWVIIESRANKFDLAAAYEAKHGGTPEAIEVADRIRNTVATKAQGDDIGSALRDWGGAAGDLSLCDEVPLYELRHLPTPGCPKGRWLRALSADLVVDDGKARYEDDLACYRINADERFGTPRAYASAHDMLGLQRVVDTLTSIPYSNQAGLGLNVLLEPYGAEVESADIREGLIKVTYKGGPQNKPEVMNMVRTAPEIFTFLEGIKASMGTKEGMDSMSMGRDNRALSGNAMALLDEKTQRAVSSLAKNHTALRGDVANGLLRRFKQFAEQSRKLSLIVGKTKRAMLGTFSNKQLKGIDRVRPETISPVMRSVSGRLEVTNIIIAAKQAGIDPEMVLTTIETGKYEPSTEGPMAAIRTIREENERLMAGEELDSAAPQLDPATGQPMLPPLGPDGVPPPQVRTALWTDNPLVHIKEHATVIASQAARRDAGLVNRVANHIDAHLRDLSGWMAGDPRMLALFGPPPQLPMPMGAVGPDGQPVAPGPGGPPNGPPPGEGGTEKKPATPKNPSTGEQWSPTGAVTNA